MTKLTSTDLRGFSYFLAVADEKTLAAAAKRLQMAQPPLSVQIRKLEERVGVALFVRGSHGMRLTEAGQALYRRAKDAIRLAQDGFDAAFAIGSGKRTVLKVGIMHALCYRFLPRIADLLQSEMPEVDFHFEELDAQSARTALETRRINVALGFAPADQHGLVGIVYGRLRYQAAVLESSLREKEGFVSLSGLSSEPLILLPAGRQGTDATGVLSLFNERGLCPKIAHRVQTVHGALALIKAGMGFALLPESVDAMLPAGVVLRPIKDVDYEIDVTANWIEGLLDTAVMEKLLKIVQPIFGSSLAKQKTI